MAIRVREVPPGTMTGACSLCATVIECDATDVQLAGPPSQRFARVVCPVCQKHAVVWWLKKLPKKSEEDLDKPATA